MITRKEHALNKAHELARRYGKAQAAQKHIIEILTEKINEKEKDTNF